MNENKKNVEDVRTAAAKDIDELDAADVVAQAREKERGEERGSARSARCGDTEYTRSGPFGGPHGMDSLLDTMKKAADEEALRQKRILRRKGWDSITIGALCALGVVSLIAAAVTDIWIPVALTMGVILSGAAGALLYRGMVVLRK